jgi:hypothetical protein
MVYALQQVLRRQTDRLVHASNTGIAADPYVLEKTGTSHIHTNFLRYTCLQLILLSNSVLAVLAVAVTPLFDLVRIYTHIHMYIYTYMYTHTYIYAYI